MKKINLKIYLRLIGVSFIMGGICLIALVNFTEMSHELCLLEAAGTIIASFCLGLYILIKKIPAPAASTTAPPPTTPAAKPAAKKKFNWEYVQIMIIGVPQALVIYGLIFLLIMYAIVPIVEACLPEKLPVFNPSAIRTLGNDPLTPYVPPGISHKGLLVYDNVLIDLPPGQEFTVATLVKGQRYTWKLNNRFYLVVRDGKGNEKLIAEPCGSDIVQESQGDGDLVIKSDHYAKGIVRVFSDKDPVFKRLPIFACISSKNCSAN